MVDDDKLVESVDELIEVSTEEIFNAVLREYGSNTIAKLVAKHYEIGMRTMLYHFESGTVKVGGD